MLSYLNSRRSRNHPVFTPAGNRLASTLPCFSLGYVLGFTSGTSPDNRLPTVVKEPQRHRLTVADFQKMNEAGILDPKARIELIDGELVDMSPIGPSQAGTVNYLSRQLTLAVGDSGLVATQNLIVLDEYNQPQPDITVLKFDRYFYRQSHPRPEDILLLVEVADSSTRVDRNEKILRYARFGIPECWLVDIPQKVLEIYRNPGPRGFQTIQRPAIISHISLSQLPKVNVDVSHLFV